MMKSIGKWFYKKMDAGIDMVIPEMNDNNNDFEVIEPPIVEVAPQMSQ